MIEVIGWIGSTLLTLCSVPLAFRAYKDGYCTVDTLFLLTWFLGEVMSLFYTIYLGNPALIMNYSLNTIFLVIIIRYKLYPRNNP